ncbi:MAG: hypothetical protein MUE73_17720 [Planctomycetes bacterium]|nr:hypothetical protein [Planctomycetota bacterium]
MRGEASLAGDRTGEGPGALTRRFCGEGGWLVGPGLPVPEDPGDCWHFKAGAVIGCGRLRCHACGQDVRERSGLYFPSAAARAAELHAAGDWGAVPGAMAAEGVRTYACACSAETVSIPACLSPDDEEVRNAPDLPWRCAGHPPGQLPLCVDGEPIDAGTDFPALIRRVAGGSPPPCCQGPHREFPAEWLCRLYVRLEPLPSGRDLAEAASSCLSDEDELTAGAALVLFDRFPRAPGHGAVAAALRRAEAEGAPTTRRARYGDGFFVFDFLEVLSRRIEEGDADPEALDLCRSALGRRRTAVAPRVFAAVARHDPGWLAANAGDLARLCLDNQDGVLKALAGTGGGPGGRPGGGGGQ